MLALPVLILSFAAAPCAPAQAPEPAVAWNARNAEHLLNRAGFGAGPEEIGAAVAAGLDATVARLLAPSSDWEMPAYEPIVEPESKEMKALPLEEQKRIQRQVRERDRRQGLAGMSWWIQRMQRGDDPLLEKMVLFWHGFFTTSIEDAKRSYLVLQQNDFLRQNALGSYATLLRGMLRDPALLTYLDNQVNRKGKPNENLARELMELFSLGEGNYTEDDVKEAARALTGRGTNRLGEYRFDKKGHDDGEKTILGRTGNLGGDELADVLLEQDACPRWVARRLISWFEGAEPDAARLDEYARVLRDGGFEVRPFLRKLFTDPRFYRREVVGARVLSPIEFLVGAARRANVEAPPAFLGAGAALLGQRLYAPPTVKGWDEGYAWITTSTLMQRGNLAGFLLGVVSLDDVLSVADLQAELEAEAAARAGSMQDGAMNEGAMQEGGTQGESMQDGAMREGAQREAPAADAKPAAKPVVQLKAPKAGGAALDMLRKVESAGWYPAFNLRLRLERAGLRTDAQVVDRLLDQLLAIEAPADTRARMLEFLAAERAERKVDDGKLLEAADAERVLRRLAHLILSLPEAQLE